MTKKKYTCARVFEMQPRVLSRHRCYILRSTMYNKTYIGYTVDFVHRLRQHNGELAGGAKRTRKGRPWVLVCEIRGFLDEHMALRFEYRLQHPKRRKPKGMDATVFTLTNMWRLIASGDGSKAAGTKTPWPPLTLFYRSESDIRYGRR
jgi:predicted GIY-YIG superfamily endonuclease